MYLPYFHIAIAKISGIKKKSYNFYRTVVELDRVSRFKMANITVKISKIC